MSADAPPDAAQDATPPVDAAPGGVDPPADPPTQIQTALDRIQAGDPSGWEELMRVSQDRLMLITRRLMRRFARLRRLG